MRAMFGLVGLLVAVALVVVIFMQTSAPQLKQGQKAQNEARQLSGRGEDGRAAVKSFQVEPKFRGSQLEGLDVTDVTAGGALASYGLQKGDEIISINGTKVGDVSNNDPEMAKDLVHQAFQGSQPIGVMRNGQQITLPPAKTTASAPAATPQQPSETPPPPQPERGNIYDQVNGIKNAAQSR